jgi:DNA-binding transcriptional ArsR family regulator
MKEESIQGFLDTLEIKKTPEKFIEENKSMIEEMRKEKKFKQELEKHKALSNEIGLLIYHLILKGELCNCAIAAILEKNEATIAHHLRKLEKAGLIIGRKKSYFTYYSAVS